MEPGDGATTTRYQADVVLTADEQFRIHAPGTIDVRDGRITWVGAAADAPPLSDSHQERLSGLLMPGLVDAHCHTPMTLLRGAGEGLPLDRWLSEVMWPREARMDADDVWWGMAMGAAELLGNGVTTTCEMYLFSEAVADAAASAGLRCTVTPLIVEGPGWERFGDWRRQLDAALRFHEQPHHPLITTVLGPHSAYALPVDALRAVREAALARDLLVHIHIAESAREGDGVTAEHGVSVPRLLADLGILDARVLAAHSIWLTDEDLDLYQKFNVSVAHCPQSNG
ncbi:MAG: amidohydrolase family protein, partial [Acidimicrobiia bacterium]